MTAASASAMRVAHPKGIPPRYGVPQRVATMPANGEHPVALLLRLDIVLRVHAALSLEATRRTSAEPIVNRPYVSVVLDVMAALRVIAPR